MRTWLCCSSYSTLTVKPPASCVVRVRVRVRVRARVRVRVRVSDVGER